MTIRVTRNVDVMKVGFFQQALHSTGIVEHQAVAGEVFLLQTVFARKAQHQTAAILERAREFGKSALRIGPVEDRVDAGGLPVARYRCQRRTALTVAPDVASIAGRLIVLLHLDFLQLCQIEVIDYQRTTLVRVQFANVDPRCPRRSPTG